MNFTNGDTYSGLNNSNTINADKAEIVDLYISGSLTGVDFTPNLTIGNVDSVPFGTPSSATITGTAQNPILNLTLEAGQRGIQGENEDLGDKNQIKGAGDILGLIGGVLGVIATVSILTAIQNQINALAGALEGLAIRVLALEVKTALLSLVGDTSRFLGDLHITSGLITNINLNSDGSALFAKKITTEDDLEAQDIITNGILKTNNIDCIGNTLNIGNQTSVNPFDSNTIRIGSGLSKVIISGDVTFIDSNFRVSTEGFISQIIASMPVPKF